MTPATGIRRAGTLSTKASSSVVDSYTSPNRTDGRNDDGFLEITQLEMDSPPVVELDLDSESMPDLDRQYDALHTSPVPSAIASPSPETSQLSQRGQCIRGGFGTVSGVYESHFTAAGSLDNKDKEDKDDKDDKANVGPKPMPTLFQAQDPLAYPKDLFAIECAQCSRSGDSICRYVSRNDPHTQLVYIDRNIAPHPTLDFFDDMTKAHYVRERRAQVGALLEVLERPSWLDEQCRDLIVATSLCHIISCVEYLIRKDWQATFASWKFAGVEDM
ncbi:hypothetical protein F503_07167 [Ophiostoma piceae UAMH 11346]|uniref:Uncharacterized protein n=1 Tax=Ophiostoma piceae (strain UAMH 11346) TaxID=1262450 RepID=S3CBP6_OPHP1|nr:hypothetical protein F503_07167 [Ophiostoma piceae UAMH 11346]